jgi:hypothetical protein
MLLTVLSTFESGEDSARMASSPCIVGSAFNTPIRAIMVSPPRLHSISTSIAVCHSGRADSFFGRLVM